MSSTAVSLRDRLAPWAVNGALLVLALELGGGIYERVVVDPVWPNNLAIIQPEAGGLNRKVFWMPLHGALTLLLPVALWASWRRPATRRWLLVATGIYVVMRGWTFAYFIPAALQFEAAAGHSPALVADARRWVLLSTLRTPLVLVAGAALWLAARRWQREQGID